jgi:hypothetical protein
MFVKHKVIRHIPLEWHHQRWHPRGPQNVKVWKMRSQRQRMCTCLQNTKHENTNQGRTRGEESTSRRVGCQSTHTTPCSSSGRGHKGEKLEICSSSCGVCRDEIENVHSSSQSTWGNRDRGTVSRQGVAIESERRG